MAAHGCLGGAPGTRTLQTVLAKASLLACTPFFRAFARTRQLPGSSVCSTRRRGAAHTLRQKGESPRLCGILLRRACIQSHGKPRIWHTLWPGRNLGTFGWRPDRRAPQEPSSLLLTLPPGAEGGPARPCTSKVVEETSGEAPPPNLDGKNDKATLWVGALLAAPSRAQGEPFDAASTSAGLTGAAVRTAPTPTPTAEGAVALGSRGGEIEAFLQHGGRCSQQLFRTQWLRAKTRSPARRRTGRLLSDPVSARLERTRSGKNAFKRWTCENSWGARRRTH